MVSADHSVAWSGAWQGSNDIGPEGMSALAGALSSMPNLTKLDLVSGGAVVVVVWWAGFLGEGGCMFAACRSGGTR